MKRKVGTTLDAGLYQRIREVARSEGRTTNSVIAEAIERFLRTRASGTSMVAETRGIIRVPKRALKVIMEEDLYGLD